jgi:Protein of unknown function (DUF2961)
VLCKIFLSSFAYFLVNIQSFAQGVDHLSDITTARTRSISAENLKGEKGKGGMTLTGEGAYAARELGQGWKISPNVIIKAHTVFTLAEIDSSGQINHIWMTIGGNWRYSVIRMYWDGENEPSVEVPVGDFFCMGLGQYAQINSLPVCVNPQSGFNCYWPMPFRKKCRITLENLDDRDIAFFYQVDYELREILKDQGYFHAQFRRSNPTPYKQDYILVDSLSGTGQYVGTYMTWGPKNAGWWGEGEIKFFMDGDKSFPTINGTGTEDYFGGSYAFDIEKKNAAGVSEVQFQEYTGPYAGLVQVVKPDGVFASQERFGMYRWHITDPIRFQRDLKVTMQVLGWKEGHRFSPLRDDVSSVSFWYQTEPHHAFPEFLSKDELEIDQH